MTVQEQMVVLARQAKAASRELSRLTTAEKNAALVAMAEALVRVTPELLTANAADLETGRELGLSKALLDRLRLDEKRILSMAEGVREVARLGDPVGRVLDDRTRPNGLRLRKVATPIGVVAIIYESRPNVTADAASLCFKTGNATILRGGKEALHSNRLIARTMVEAGRAVLPGRFPEHAIQVVPVADREAIPALLGLPEYVDLCMPRGGEGLIRAVAACSKVPVIKHYKGVCHVFVDRAADPAMAERVVLNAKVQRPSACNAMETLLVDAAVARELVPRLARRLAEQNVELHCDAASLALAAPAVSGLGTVVRAATEPEWSTEYNDFVANVRVVAGLEEAIQHIHQYGSSHSDAIVTADRATAERFLSEVDSAAVYWNASTRFTDGGEFGMGAEIGISTDKVGARGPLGLDELCSYKWIGVGEGLVRE